MVALTIVLQGCAAGIEKPTGSDIVTESDETPARKRAKIRLELAAGYYSNGQTKIALDEVKQSIAADPRMYEAHNLRGLIYMQLADYPLADESFKRALQINPTAASVQHNYGWMLCQQGRMPEAYANFAAAINNPQYLEKAKSWLAMGVCQKMAGLRDEALVSLTRAHELDPGNPVSSYNLASLQFLRGDFVRAQFQARRVNNSEFANSESLWLGVKIERAMGNRDSAAQLGAQLTKRFPSSKEAALFERGAFNE
jgi:type IV pilus assembly protein PilF